MSDFKAGDFIRCVRWAGETFKVGTTYIVTEHKGMLGLTSEFSSFCAAPWYMGLFELEAPRPVEPPFPPRTPTVTLPDIAEARLHALWLAVPANCCAKCAAPLPCKYHE